MVGAGSEVLEGQAWPECLSLLLLPDDPDVELSAPSPASCLPACTGHFDMTVTD